MANELEREVRELRQANEILRKASAYFAQVRKAMRHCFSIACSGSTARFANDRFRCADLRFIEESRGSFGVEPICKALQFAPSTYYDRRIVGRDPDRASARARSDAALSVKIDAAWDANRKLYGARKIWHVLRRERQDIAPLYGGEVDAAPRHQGRGSRQKGHHDESGHRAAMP